MSEFVVQYFCYSRKHAGQGFAEYGLIFSLVCIVTLVVLKTMGN